VIWTLTFRKSARRELEDLPSEMLRRVELELMRLGNNPFPVGVKKLKGSNNYRVRVGTYRIIFHVHLDEQEVEIIAIKHRREAYRRRS